MESNFRLDTGQTFTHKEHLHSTQLGTVIFILKMDPTVYIYIRKLYMYSISSTMHVAG